MSSAAWRVSLIRKQSSASTNQPLTSPLFYFVLRSWKLIRTWFFSRRRGVTVIIVLCHSCIFLWLFETDKQIFVFTLKTMSPAAVFFRRHHKDVVLVPLRSCSKTAVQSEEFLYCVPCWDPFCEFQPIPPKASAPWLIIKFLLAFGCTSHGFLSASGERHSTPPSCQQGK